MFRRRNLALEGLFWINFFNLEVVPTGIQLYSFSSNIIYLLIYLYILIEGSAEISVKQ